MTGNRILRDATPADEVAIEHLLDLGFGLSRRTKTSYRLREGSKPVPGLSLVMEEQGFGLVGSISFWPLVIGSAEALLLGPIAVHPQRQNQGIGLALMREGIARSQIRPIILVGDLPYYARVGFAKVPEGQLLLPGPVDPNRLLHLGDMTGIKGLVLPPHRVS
jgi:predicted N-acetyltransferase YhbS